MQFSTDYMDCGRQINARVFSVGQADAVMRTRTERASMNARRSSEESYGARTFSVFSDAHGGGALESGQDWRALGPCRTRTRVALEWFSGRNRSTPQLQSLCAALFMVLDGASAQRLYRQVARLFGSSHRNAHRPPTAHFHLWRGRTRD